MHKIRVGVIRGGVSNEYPVSIKTGATVLNNLGDRYEGVDVFIDKEGVWHLAGVPQHPKDIFPHVDVIFNALHGYYGEDGKIQALFESYNIPYVGSDSFGSAFAMNKILAKEVFEKEKIRTPYYATIKEGDDIEKEAQEIYKKLPQPLIVKPASSGSSLGMSMVETFPQFLNGIKEALKEDSSVLIEEAKKGREVSCALLEGFRGEEAYVFPAIEIITPPEKTFFDYDAKYSGVSEEVCPVQNLTKEQKEELITMTKKAHKALGLRHYSRSDFIVTSEGAYILEVNTLPGLTENSLFPQSIASVGCTLPQFLDHIISLALHKK